MDGQVEAQLETKSEGKANGRADETKRARDLVQRVAQVLDEHRKKGNLLAQIAWPREVEEGFFAASAGKLPEVTYTVDRDGLEAHLADLRRVSAFIEEAGGDGDDHVATWLRAVLASQADSDRLLLAVGTKAFSDLSKEIYGGATAPFYEGKTRNLDLAEHLLERLGTHGWDEATDKEEGLLSASEFAESLRGHIERMRPRMDVTVELEPKCTAKVLAGMKRIHIRPDATFARWEAEGLFFHEVETHALTAQNGAAQPEAPFLASGGPRTTRTQEGLAVFAELYNHTLTAARLERLAVRVKLVAMAEDGASFLDLYRYLIERGSAPRDAYLDAQRICRGGLVSGGAPFTKDASYLSGLVHVYAFLNAFIRGGFRDETELLVCGRIDLADLTALIELRALGILTRPKYRPRWLRNWGTLLPFFAFSSFIGGLDLKPIEQEYEAAIALAAKAGPPSPPSEPPVKPSA